MSLQDPPVEVWTTKQVAQYLGVKIKSADSQLRRWGLAPVSRYPGRDGQNVYLAAEVRAADAGRPGQGARTDRIR